MKKLLPAVLLSTILLSGCTFTFGGTVFLITIRDLVLYVMIVTILAALASLLRPKPKRISGFWIAFILGLLLTPLATFIYLLIMLTGRSKPDNSGKNNSDTVR